MLYNYLFYKGYQLAVKSKNFEGIPIVGAIIFVSICVMFNLFSILLFFEGLGLIDVTFNNDNKLYIGLGFVLFTLCYYLFNSRYKRIIKKYEDLERAKRLGIHPILVFLAYYSISFGLLLLAGLYRNGDWIFRK